MFGEKLQRVRFLRGIAYADGSVYNVGDVADLEPALARTVVEAGLAEATANAVGRAAPLSEEKACWRCGGQQSFYNGRCEFCASPI